MEGSPGVFECERGAVVKNTDNSVWWRGRGGAGSLVPRGWGGGVQLL